MAKNAKWLRTVSLTTLLLASVGTVSATDIATSNTAIDSSDVTSGLTANGIATISIASDSIKLGDLFDNIAPSLVGKDVLAAPKEGETLTLSAFQVLQLARENGIDYTLDAATPTYSFTRVADTEIRRDMPDLTVEVVRNPKVTGNHVRLGDVFKGYFSDAGVVIAEAPAPGEKLSISLNDLRSLAEIHGLTLEPTGSLMMVNVQRASQKVAYGDIELLVENALYDFGFNRVNRLKVFGDYGSLLIPQEDNISDIFVSGLSLTAVDRFQADLVLPTGKPAPRIVTVRGSFEASQANAKQITTNAGDRFIAEEKTAEAESLAIEETVSPVTVGINAQISLAGDSVTIGDLFTNAPAEIEATELMQAPAPGTSKTLSTSLARSIAEDYGLRLDAPRHITKITVMREGIRLAQDDILAALSPSLQSMGIDHSFEISLRTGVSKIFLPLSASFADIEVEALTLSPRRDRFSAELVLPSGNAQPILFKVNGSLTEIRDIPVLNRSITPGETITLSDIDYRSVPLSRVNRATVADARQLVGMTVRRSVSQGMLIRANDIIRPIVVEKGTPVTMTLVAGPMKLATAGRAIENGAVGDLVRVENSQSGKVIDARVVAPGRVEAVFLAKAIFAQNTNTASASR